MAKRYEKKKEAARLVRQQQEREKKRKQILMGTGILAVVLVVAIVVAAVLYVSQGREVTKPKAKTDGGALVVSKGPVKVDLYEDFICPVCKQFMDSSHEKLDEYAKAGKIQLNFHPLGLLDSYSTTKYSSRSAAAAVCAADRDKFSEYEASLFANQPPEQSEGLDDDKLISLGTELKLGKSFKKCVEDETYRGWVDEQTSKATDAGISQTPTLKINGKDVDKQKFMTVLAKKVGDDKSKESDDSGKSKDNEDGKKDDESGD